MFIQGQKVVCVDDMFTSEVRRIYRALPVKGRVYVVRAIGVGRGALVPSSPGASDGELVVYLVGLFNPDGEARFSRSGLELGFKAERFAPLDTLPEVEEEKELVLTQ